MKRGKYAPLVDAVRKKREEATRPKGTTVNPEEKDGNTDPLGGHEISDDGYRENVRRAQRAQNTN